ncbi:hypothetical protein TUMSATVNIG1_37950 [Vibrio nigripulchritudo]|uniref:AHH domain-containing protein n=1 Tax=Vibrio nigripulchritudo TaxID=28173 RepID=UPI0019096E15|nr:AHH domain-containing protein [Vibrio nigripulchritudo]BCL71828.1 hypothetical protein VNTUMSATTG_37650 [Vibrio nigripulchritudo]BDU33186.1 hypothetical protein TUMSATVNIG1_37950 [Vibrio nigripulchritudo]BDU39235.1 hypothetical protein TUMSATVNIG2_37040 [Vibrio nigripulchritudo]BDU44955.1 hypothetical protein TUMSATVNIG3_37530 [Vibrio nigripulchritudo]
MSKSTFGGKNPIAKLPSRPSNPTPLELAIHRFQKDALRVKNKLDANPNAKGKDLDQIKEDIAHLDREMIRISTQSSLQSQLEKYRTDNKDKSTVELSKEAHHPTDNLSNFLYAVGEPKPSNNHHPHHIIMGNGKSRMMRVRLQMHRYGIGINDPINGVWLPRSSAFKGHFTTPKAPPHSRIHTYNYETWISENLAHVRRNEAVFIGKLKTIKREIKSGSHPDKILEKKDKNWSPNA